MIACPKGHLSQCVKTPWAEWNAWKKQKRLRRMQGSIFPAEERPARADTSPLPLSSSASPPGPPSCVSQLYVERRWPACVNVRGRPAHPDFVAGRLKKLRTLPPQARDTAKRVKDNSKRTWASKARGTFSRRCWYSPEFFASHWENLTQNLPNKLTLLKIWAVEDTRSEAVCCWQKDDKFIKIISSNTCLQKARLTLKRTEPTEKL